MDGAEEASDAGVVGLRATVGAVEGAPEGADDGGELLEDDGLDFDLADLFENDPRRRE